MILKNEKCSLQNLFCLLEDDPTNADYQLALQHLEQCAECQQKIEQLAANSEAWQAAKTVLTSEEFRDRIASTKDSHSWDHLPPVAWSESMVKQLLAPASHPEMLGRIGRYDIERLIGSGGMGLVFKAHDTELNRVVAIKVLAPYLAGIGSARKRFAREARAAAAIIDDNVVAIYNVELNENLDDAPYLVMKYIAGGSLQQRIDRDGPLDTCEILRIGVQIARGLAAAHAQGLIHRDVKPSNILMDEGVERALLTDFGLVRAENDACLTRSGFHPGTPHYMAPEQVLGQEIDARCDLFGLGAVLYAMCVGHPPFRAETSFAVLRRITDDDPRPVRQLNSLIPDWLEKIVMKLLEKNPEHRFESAEQVASLLGRCLAHVQHPTQNQLPDWITQQRVRPQVAIRSRMFGLALLTTIILTACGILVYQTENQNQELAPALVASGVLSAPASSSSVPAVPPLQEVEPPALVGMTEAAKELKKLRAEYGARREAYQKTVNHTESNRANEEPEFHEIMAPKFLEMESRFRGTVSGLNALMDAEKMADRFCDPDSVTGKARAEAIDRMISHYIKFGERTRTQGNLAGSGTVEIIDIFPFQSVISRIDYADKDSKDVELLNLLVKENPNPSTQAAALVQLIKHDQFILDSIPQLPKMRKEIDELTRVGGVISQLNEKELKYLRRKRLLYEKFIKRVEHSNTEQIRIEVNEKLRRLSLYGDIKVGYDLTAATAAAFLSHAINEVVIGKPAPEIKTLDIDAKQFQLSALRGSIVILLFEQSSEFKETHSSIRQLVAKYAPSSVQVVSVIGTRDLNLLKAARDRGEITWTVLPEPPMGPLFRSWGIDHLGPTARIIDSDGTLSAPLSMPYYGAGGYDTSEVVAVLDELLKKRARSAGGANGSKSD